MTHQPAGPRSPAAPERPGWPRRDVVLLALLLIWPLALWAFTRARAPWGDEEHYLTTARLFGQGLSLELLRSYPEMTAPLTFVLYAAWGHVAGFGTPALRLLSVLLAWLTAALWWTLLRRDASSRAWALVALAVLVFNPYFIGLSIFVFTDMLALLGLALATHGVTRDRPWMVVAGVAIATLTRQYLVFLVPAIALVDLLRTSGGRGRLLAAAAAGLAPLGVMVIIWGGGLSPINTLRGDYLTDGLRFDPRALSLYLALPGLYALPVLLPRLARVPARTWLTAAGLAAIVWIFPVGPSASQVREGSLTVGLLHNALATRLPAPAVTAIFYIGATIGLAWTIAALPVARRQWRRPLDAFPWAAAAAFLLVMPFSYMPWEKYALPLLMLVGLMAVRAGTGRS